MTKNFSKHLGIQELDDEAFRERVGKGKILTHISLFSGGGGLDIGFAQAGIETRVMVEFEGGACDTLRRNFHWDELKERKNPDGTLVWNNKEEMKKEIDWYHDKEPVVVEMDVRDVKTEELLKVAGLQIGECSIISGGFPCQGFSIAGKKEVNDPRNFLYKEFVRIVNETKPAIIIGENVPGIISMEKGKIMKQICEDFANCGYDVTWKLINCADYGVPQIRKRVILFGNRVDVMVMKEDGTMQVHLGAQKGKITHPQLFYDRLKRWGKVKK